MLVVLHRVHTGRCSWRGRTPGCRSISGLASVGFTIEESHFDAFHTRSGFQVERDVHRVASKQGGVLAHVTNAEATDVQAHDCSVVGVGAQCGVVLGVDEYERVPLGAHGHEQAFVDAVAHPVGSGLKSDEVGNLGDGVNQ